MNTINTILYSPVGSAVHILKVAGIVAVAEWVNEMADSTLSKYWMDKVPMGWGSKISKGLEWSVILFAVSNEG